MKPDIKYINRIGNIFILWIILFTIVFILIIGFLVISSEENSAVESYRVNLKNLNKRYAENLQNNFNRLKKLGSSANRVVSESVLSISERPGAKNTFMRGSDGAVRVSDGYSAFFISRKTSQMGRLREMADKTGMLWKKIVPIITVDFLNYYIITRENFIRIYPPKWSMEIEADHDFSGDIFYSVGTPAENPEKVPVWTPVYYDSIWNKWMTSLIIPIYGNNDEFLGITGSDYILDDLFLQVETIKKVEKWCSGFIFDSGGRMIIHKDYMNEILNRQVNMNEALPSTDLKDPHLKNFIDGIIKASILPGKISVTGNEDNPRYFTARPIGNSGWYLSLYTDHRTLTGRFQSIRVKIFLVLSILGIILILVIRELLKNIIFSRIYRLNEAVSAFTDENMDIPVEVVKNDEIGILEKGFSSMQDSIREKISILTDEILRRERAEVGYRLSEENIRNIFNSGHDAIFIHDVSGKIFDVNKTMLKMYGVTRGEALISNIKDFSGPDNPFDKLGDIWESVLNGNPHEFEWISQRPGDGKLFEVQVNLNRIYFEGKDLINATVRDITNRKEAERRAEDEREKLSITLRSIGDGVITTDTSGRVQFLNYISEQLTGWDSEEALGKPIEKIFSIFNYKTQEMIETPVSRVIRTGKMVLLSEDTILKSKDGNVYNISDSAAPIMDTEGNVRGVVLVFRDVTERLKTEKELLKIAKLESLGLLAGGIAHDFNNLLAGLFGNISLAKKRIDPENRAYKNLEAAENAFSRASDLTRQLLTFARGGEPVKDIADVTKIIRDSSIFALRGSSIRLDLDFQEGLPMAEVDAGQVGQVISNLVINAKQAMPDGGGVKISVSSFNNSNGDMPVLNMTNYLKITVADEGKGISKKNQEKIFDPYFTTKQEGNGLGLATVYSIISKHDGLVTVSSEPGEGAAFTIYLPSSLKDIIKVKTAVYEPGETLPDINARVLVMDDDAGVAGMIQDMLIEIGCKCMCVSSGREVIDEYFRSRDEGDSYDIIIMDLTIQGGIGGKEAVKIIKDEYPDARCIVSSGYSTDPVMANFREYGFSGHIAKPYKLMELYNEIVSVLGEDGTG